VLVELIAVLQTDRGFKNTALDFTTPLIHTHICDFSHAAAFSSWGMQCFCSILSSLTPKI